MLHLAGLAVILFLIFKIVSVLLAGPYFLSLRKEFSDLKLLKQALRAQIVLEKTYIPLITSWQDGTVGNGDFLSKLVEADSKANNELGAVQANLSSAMAACRESQREKEFERLAQNMHKRLTDLHLAATALVQAHTMDGLADPNSSPESSANSRFEKALQELNLEARGNVFSLSKMREQAIAGWRRLKAMCTGKS